MRDDGDEMPSPGKVETLRQQGIVHGGVSKVVQTKGGLLRLPYTTKSRLPSSLRESLAVAAQSKAEGGGLERAIARQMAMFTITACDAAGAT